MAVMFTGLLQLSPLLSLSSWRIKPGVLETSNKILSCLESSTGAGFPEDYKDYHAVGCLCTCVLNEKHTAQLLCVQLLYLVCTMYVTLGLHWCGGMEIGRNQYQ